KRRFACMATPRRCLLCVLYESVAGGGGSEPVEPDTADTRRPPAAAGEGGGLDSGVGFVDGSHPKLPARQLTAGDAVVVVLPHLAGDHPGQGRFRHGLVHLLTWNLSGLLGRCKHSLRQKRR